MEISEVHDFSCSVILTVTEQLEQSKEGKGKRDLPYSTIEPLNDPNIIAAREKQNLSHLSLTMAVRSPRIKAKQH
jgi:hypothetical protein